MSPDSRHRRRALEEQWILVQVDRISYILQGVFSGISHSCIPLDNTGMETREPRRSLYRARPQLPWQHSVGHLGVEGAL